MEINLNFLKFHYFYKDKKLHNLCVKQWREYLKKIIFNNKNSLIEIIKNVNKCKNFSNLKNILLHFHIINNDHKYILLNEIIKKSHPNLYNQMEQYFSNDNYFKDLAFYQCRISKKERLIFTIHKNLKNKLSFIPLILDLNHVIYIPKDKQYDNLNLNGLQKWDLKKEQENIKISLNQKNNNI